MIALDEPVPFTPVDLDEPVQFWPDDGEDYLLASCRGCLSVFGSQDPADLVDYLDTHHCLARQPEPVPAAPPGRLF